MIGSQRDPFPHRYDVTGGTRGRRGAQRQRVVDLYIISFCVYMRKKTEEKKDILETQLGVTVSHLLLRGIKASTGSAFIRRYNPPSAVCS